MGLWELLRISFMKLNYKNFEIEIFNDGSFALHSADNTSSYKNVYYSDNDDFNNKIAVRTFENSQEISNAIICENGTTNGLTENSFIINDNKIWICISNKIYCLEIPSLKLIYHKKLDSVTNFTIYKFKDDFIIHGELEIFRITQLGDIKWSFSGKDIWVNIEGKQEVEIKDDRIKLIDFENNEYEIDFNGIEISEK